MQRTSCPTVNDLDRRLANVLRSYWEGIGVANCEGENAGMLCWYTGVYFDVSVDQRNRYPYVTYFVPAIKCQIISGHIEMLVLALGLFCRSRL